MRRGYRAAFPDVFDPNFQKWLVRALAEDGAFRHHDSPWLLGFVIDDTDDLWGFGAGPDFATKPRGHGAPHLGWMALITAPTQSKSSRLPNPYQDQKVYTKFALRDFLAKKYGSIETLNAAWSSNYTTLDSDGGWPDGRGLLDESGKGSWVGTDSDALANTKPAVKADLDLFLYELAKKYFTLCRAAVKKQFPNALYFGPTTVGTWSAPARRPILKAAGESVDLLQINYDGTQAQLDYIVEAAGDVPLAVWIGTVANPDSGMWRAKQGEGPSSFASQKERGAFYRSVMLRNYEAVAARTRAHPFVGATFWELHDNPGEKANWGLVSVKDNAYDGVESRVVAGKDQWSYSTGGEEKDFGDALAGISGTNREILSRLKSSHP